MCWQVAQADSGSVIDCDDFVNDLFKNYLLPKYARI